MEPGTIIGFFVVLFILASIADKLRCCYDTESASDYGDTSGRSVTQFAYRREITVTDTIYN